MDPQLIERAMDMIEDMIDGRAAGDHGFTGGAKTAWRAQKRKFLWFARGLITGANPQFIEERGVRFKRSECPVSFARRRGRKERGTKGGSQWVMNAFTLIEDVRRALP